MTPALRRYDGFVRLAYAALAAGLVWLAGRLVREADPFIAPGHSRPARLALTLGARNCSGPAKWHTRLHSTKSVRRLRQRDGVAPFRRRRERHDRGCNGGRFLLCGVSATGAQKEHDV